MSVFTGGVAMKSRQAILIAATSLLFVPVAMLAHHSLNNQFDMKKTVTLVGEVKKIDWSNPHVRLFMDVKDDSNAGSWEVDMGSPNLQLLNGWKIDTYPPGAQVKVEIHPARDGSKLGYGMKVTALRR
jgi:hypothetical protein